MTRRPPEGEASWQWLTAEERTRFEDDGYLVVRDAIPSEMVHRLTQAIDRQTQDAPARLYNVADIIGRDDAFFDMIDRPTIHPKIVSILGVNVAVCHSHFNVNPPEPLADDASYDYGWHRDGGSVHRDMNIFPEPRLALKVGFYLTDLSARGGGQTYIVPRSHLTNDLLELETGASRRNLRRSARPEQLGAVPLLVEPGTAVIYDGRVVHSLRSRNGSAVTRKAIFLEYAFRWMCPVDAMSVATLRDRCDPIRAQLLGFTSTFHDVGTVPGEGRSGKYYPTDADLPIRMKLVADLGRA